MAHWIRRLPPGQCFPGSNLGGDFFISWCLFFIFLFFYFNLLLFLICFFFLIYSFIFFLIYLKGLCHGFLFLHKSRSPCTPLITLRVNSFFYCFSSMFTPFVVSGRACMTVSRSTDDNNVFCPSSQKDDSR